MIQGKAIHHGDAALMTNGNIRLTAKRHNIHRRDAEIAEESQVSGFLRDLCVSAVKAFACDLRRVAVVKEVS